MALYHKYRPQTFSDVIDQEHIIQTLINQVLHNKISHAYLFAGPRGVGKTTTARILAKSLNCTGKKENTAEPCNECQSCNEIVKSNSIDVIEIDAASHTGVDNVRQNIIENSQFKPTTSKYKIFIIDEVHMLSTAAFNALLKTLEEPPSYVVFILATTDPQKLPATILSRCQRYTFTKVPAKEMTKSLKNIAKKEGVEVDEEVLLRVARKSEGCLRDGISLLEQLLASGEKHVTEETASLVLPSVNIEFQLEFSKYLAERQQSPALHFLQKINNEGINLAYFSHEFIEFLRILMIAGIDMNLAEQELDLNKETKEKIDELKNILNEIEIIKLLDLAIRRDSEVKNSVLPQLPLEMLVVEWCNQDNQIKQTMSQNSQTIIEQKKPVQTPAQNIQTIPEIVEQVIPAEIKEKIIETKIEEIQEIDHTENITNSTNSINKEQVENSWSAIIKILEKEAPSLTFILKMSKITDVKNNIIVLSVEYSFHKEKLMENTTRQKFEDILEKIFGQKVKIDILEISNSNKQKENDNPLGDLAVALGGEILG